MKMLAAAIVIGPLLLIGALPAAAQSTMPPGSGASVQTPAPVDTAADRDKYKQKARDEVQAWQRKLSKKVAARGSAADNAAENDLDKAWIKTEAASDRLQTVGAEGWDSAKASFEAASRELAAAWDRI